MLTSILVARRDGGVDESRQWHNGCESRLSQQAGWQVRCGEVRWPWTICFAAAKDPLEEVWIGSLGPRHGTTVSEGRRGRKNFDLAGRGRHDLI